MGSEKLIALCDDLMATMGYRRLRKAGLADPPPCGVPVIQGGKRRPSNYARQKYFSARYKSVDDLPSVVKMNKTGRLPPGSPFDVEDTHLKRILREQGFDRKPQIISEEQFQEFVKQGERPLYRGLAGGNVTSGETYAEQFRTGKLFAGKGLAGNGTYAAFGQGAEEMAASYAAGPTGATMKMVLRKEAKVIKHDELFKLRSSLMNKVDKQWEERSNAVFKDAVAKKISNAKGLTLVEALHFLPPSNVC